MSYEKVTDEELLNIAKAYAYQTFKRAYENPEPDWQGNDEVPRTRQINAEKILRTVLQLNENTDSEAFTPTEFGVAVAAYKRELDKE